MTSTTQYRPDIDGLRAFAIVSVMVFHAFPTVLPGGFVGVDVFFVISGYLITKIICRGTDNGSFSLLQFYLRRVRRIFPALIVVLAAMSIMALYVMGPSELHSFAATVAGSAAFVSNLVLWSQSGYFDTAATTKPLLHLWSLGVEEQFYIVWPLVIMIAPQRARVYVFLLLFVGSFVACQVMTHHDPVAAFYSPFSRAWELAAGGLVYCVSGRLRPFTKRYPVAREVAFTIGCLLFVLALVITSEANPFPGWQALIPVVGAAIIVAFGGQSRIAGLILGNSVGVKIGRISYPLYLWHWPLLVIGRQLGYHSATATGVIVVLTILLSIGTYRLIELPIQRQPVGSLQFFSLVVPLGSIGLYGFVATSIDPRALIYPTDIRAAAQYSTYEAGAGARVGSCWVEHNTLVFSPECYFHEAGGKPRVAIWGDSHAARLYPGILRVLGDKVEVAQFTKDGCSPADGGKTGCGSTNRLVMDYLLKNAVDTIVIFANWSDHVHSNSFRSDLELILSRLRSNGKRVVMIGPYPNFPTSLPDMVVKQWLAGEISGVPDRIPGAPMPNTKMAETAVSNVSSSQKTMFVSLISYLCDENGCLSNLPSGGTQLIVWDYGHLTLAGATMVAEHIYPLMGLEKRQ
ncbi:MULTISPECIES: acyltransferase family protein [Agrobacterium]|uniref:acyltransferase family protein n=1 Tax=Agrobacterium TaxID=357 RepID=UPI0009BB7A75|nr:MULTISPECIES: acyltransferase family protein [Agrobacterium]QCL72191.1 hypothetical protein CFBP5499_01200 [Agrobacterium tumefaciens]CUX23102.1 putative Acyltransferase 3 [Agrobacterium sp. NCPPB 925]